MASGQCAWQVAKLHGKWPRCLATWPEPSATGQNASWWSATAPGEFCVVELIVKPPRAKKLGRNCGGLARGTGGRTRASTRTSPAFPESQHRARSGSDERDVFRSLETLYVAGRGPSAALHVTRHYSVFYEAKVLEILGGPLCEPLGLGGSHIRSKSSLLDFDQS